MNPLTANTTIAKVIALWAFLLAARVSYCHANSMKENDKNKNLVPQTFMHDNDWFLFYPNAFCINHEDVRQRAYYPLLCAMPEDFALSRIQGLEPGKNAAYTVKEGDNVVLGKCLGDTEEGWRLEFVDDATIFRTAANDYGQGDFCLQAGHGGDIDEDEDDKEVRIRLYRCDSSNPLQRFKWYEESTSCTDEQLGGSIRLEGHPGLCLGWNRGSYLQPTKNQLRLWPCHQLPLFQESGWTAF